MDSYRKNSSAEAKAILKSGISTLDALTSSLAALPYRSGNDALSQAESAFVATLGAGDVEKANEVVDAAYKVTRDALAMGSQHTRVLERFVTLHVPQMEDGNNFGVTVQLMFSKLLSDEREKMDKALSESSKYYSSRADAIDKFSHLPKSSVTQSKSTSTSSAKGGKEGDENKDSTSTSTEEKISTSDGGKINLHRVKALAALDAQTYIDLASALQSMVDGYVVILDNLQKNWDKLESPRGKGYGGYGSGGHSMVY
mmetsp:Transcript_254/g.504  ORF Transcript_254/g.504 Transcript_254/m.504 type:complete len:256 (-) Transcript_254:133-900(-)|eukprot:CAMPEP_0172310052 /NCGR_PEP_ID=MMETSP1058-20130122/11227_1 /TAXON_ID=83371 /ORGANISM="Detonula confervacea, Strain CCMP 353" /LENGTH=255 /DNA_ID=CAMNT_0013022807 /DNA_START=57 /DNA_END=824 /DNA_ORIENTATION=+